MPTLARLRVPALLSSGLLLVFLAGCSSETESGRHGGEGHRRPPITPMAGQDTFFDGKLLAALTVGTMERPADVAEGHDDKASGAAEAGGHGHHGGGGGMGMGGGGRGGHGGRGGGDGSYPGPDGEGGGRPEGMRPMMSRLGAPVMIHLKFTNQGTERVQVYIADFSSPLGNFAVQPEVLTLDPGQSLETEPMSSQLADSLAETQATLALRIGGKTEKKVVVLRAVAPVTAPATGEQPADKPAK